MEMYNKIIAALKNGYTVVFSTYLSATKITAKHIPILKCVNGHIYIRNVDYTYCAIRAYK